MVTLEHPEASTSCLPPKSIILTVLLMCILVEITYFSEHLSRVMAMLPLRYYTPLDLTAKQPQHFSKHLPKFLAMLPEGNWTALNDSSVREYTPVPRLETQGANVLTVEVNRWCRLGNRIFILASLLGIAAKNNMTVYLPPGGFDLLFGVFQLKVTRHLHRMKSHKEIDFIPFNSGPQNCDSRLDSIRTLNASIRIQGFLQCIENFDWISGFLRQELQLKGILQRKAKRVLRAVAPGPNMTSVGVHVRRGDFLIRIHQRKGLAVAPAGYFIHAMERIRKKDPNVFFFVASDDINWAKNNIRGINVKFSNGLSSAEDFAVLVNCDHIIISSGTFGWWAAWLNGGTTIYYEGYPRKGSSIWNRTDCDGHRPILLSKLDWHDLISAIGSARIIEQIDAQCGSQTFVRTWPLRNMDPKIKCLGPSGNCGLSSLLIT